MQFYEKYEKDTSKILMSFILIWIEKSEFYTILHQIIVQNVDISETD